MARMSQAHFELIAEVLSEARKTLGKALDPIDAQYLEDLFVEALKATNEHFNEDRFRKAAK